MELQDSMLEQVSGGVKSSSQWRIYVSETITPSLNSILSSPNVVQSDRAAAQRIYDVFASTSVLGAAIDAPVSTLIQEYRIAIRQTIVSNAVRNILDNVIDRASNYLVTHQ